MSLGPFVLKIMEDIWNNCTMEAVDTTSHTSVIIAYCNFKLSLVFNSFSHYSMEIFRFNSMRNITKCNNINLHVTCIDFRNFRFHLSGLEPGTTYVLRLKIVGDHFCSELSPEIVIKTKKNCFCSSICRIKAPVTSGETFADIYFKEIEKFIDKNLCSGVMLFVPVVRNVDGGQLFTKYYFVEEKTIRVFDLKPGRDYSVVMNILIPKFGCCFQNIEKSFTTLSVPFEKWTSMEEMPKEFFRGYDPDNMENNSEILTCLQATEIGDNFAHISWKVEFCSNSSKYMITYFKDGSMTSRNLEISEDGDSFVNRHGKTRSILIPNLDPDTYYGIKISVPSKIDKTSIDLPVMLIKTKKTNFGRIENISVSEVTFDKISIFWTQPANLNSLLRAYEICFSNKTFKTNKTNFTFENLEQNSDYCIKIRPLGVGESVLAEFSHPIVVKTLNYPLLLSCENIGPNSVTLVWSPCFVDCKYKLTQKMNSKKKKFYFCEGKNHFCVEGLREGTFYTFSVTDLTHNVSSHVARIATTNVLEKNSKSVKNFFDKQDKIKFCENYDCKNKSRDMICEPTKNKILPTKESEDFDFKPTLSNIFCFSSVREFLVASPTNLTILFLFLFLIILNIIYIYIYNFLNKN